MGYKKSFGEINIEILSGVQEVLHSHVDVELLCNIEGSCTCMIGQQQYRMQKQDIILVNSGETHSLSIDSHSLICRLWIACDYLGGLPGSDYIRFCCNSLINTGFKYTELRKNLIFILLDYLEGNQKQVYRQLGRYYLLLDKLMTDFRENGQLVEQNAEWISDQKIMQIMQYIYTNISEKISLTEIADRLFMSPSTLSRFFKKKTGVFFNQYIKDIRLQKVAEALRKTDMTATRLSVEYGFSNPSAMSTEFKEKYGVTPSAYRKQWKVAIQKEEEQKLIRKERLIEILQIEKEQLVNTAENVFVSVDTSIGHPYKMWKNRIANIGPARILETANIRKHIQILKEQLDIEYIRIWSLFSERLMIREKSGDDINFSKLDELFDFCVANNLKLFLDMAPRTDIVMASEKRSIYTTEEGILFESQAEWENCLEKFCRHIVWRYGQKIVGTWIFEFSFFLNARPYFVSDLYSPRIVWNSGRRIIKNCINNAKIAGPGLRTTLDASLLDSIMENFMKIDIKPDIFTSYNFPYNQENNGQLHKLSDVQFLGKQIDLVKSMLKKYDFQGKYYITDWNNSLANRNFIQDSCYRGTFVLKNVLEYYDKVDEMGFWYASDFLNVYYDTEGIISGSAGILTKDGIRKPVFYALLFLKDLGNKFIAKGENYIITKNDANDIRILCFNNKNLGPEYFLVEEDSHKPEEVSQLFLNKDMLKLKIRLKNLPYNDTFIIRQKIINETNGSILSKWIEMGCEKDLLPEDIQYLSRTSVPSVKIQRIQVEKNYIELNIEMEPHEMCWISIMPN